MPFCCIKSARLPAWALGRKNGQRIFAPKRNTACLSSDSGQPRRQLTPFFGKQLFSVNSISTSALQRPVAKATFDGDRAKTFLFDRHRFSGGPSATLVRRRDVRCSWLRRRRLPPKRTQGSIPGKMFPDSKAPAKLAVCAKTRTSLAPSSLTRIEASSWMICW